MATYRIGMKRSTAVRTSNLAIVKLDCSPANDNHSAYNRLVAAFLKAERAQLATIDAEWNRIHRVEIGRRTLKLTLRYTIWAETEELVLVHGEHRVYAERVQMYVPVAVEEELVSGKLALRKWKRSRVGAQ